MTWLEFLDSFTPITSTIEDTPTTPRATLAPQGKHVLSHTNPTIACKPQHGIPQITFGPEARRLPYLPHKATPPTFSTIQKCHFPRAERAKQVSPGPRVHPDIRALKGRYRYSRQLHMSNSEFLETRAPKRHEHSETH